MLLEFFKTGSTAFLLRQEALKDKAVTRQARVDQCRHKGRCSRQGLYLNATGAMEPQVVETNVSTPLTANSFKRINYQFEGWTTNADGSGDKYADEGNITAMGDLTLYAKWKKIACAITYDRNDPHTGGDQMPQQNVSIGNTATIRECAYTPVPGEVFAYWQDQDGNKYYPNDKITFEKTDTDIRRFAYIDRAREIRSNCMMKEQKYNRLIIREYIAYDGDGQAYTALTRLVGLQ